MKTMHVLALGLALSAAGPSAGADRPVRMDGRGAPAPASVASFDCARATGFAETAICADAGLAYGDRAISETYQRLLRHAQPGEQGAIRQRQRDWLRARDACGDRACLETALDDRARTLRAALDDVDRRLRARVARVGQCETTRIDFIGPRLTPVQGEPPSGTSIGFANGVWQVSYDRVAEVLRSRPGDAARVCLTAIPRGCPPGDDRGRAYRVENLRTGARWSLPDAAHRCGGA